MGLLMLAEVFTTLLARSTILSSLPNAPSLLVSRCQYSFFCGDVPEVSSQIAVGRSWALPSK